MASAITIPAHRCTEPECCSFGQVTSPSCGCHKTTEQVQGELIGELTAVAKGFCEMIDDDPERFNIAEPSCNECTMGCTPHAYDKGPCAYHTAKSIIKRLEG